MQQTAWQVEIQAAELFDSHFVPAIFGRWAEDLVRFAGLKPGDSILDVACGTGAVARAARNAVGADGRVVGSDINEGMLAVAKRQAGDIDWVPADVASLPFEDDTFDAVICQSALMFFPDPVAAIREMARVAKPGGAVVLQSWGRTSGYEMLAGVFDDIASSEAAAIIRAPFSLHDMDRLLDMARQAGLTVEEHLTHWGVAEFASMDDFVRTEIMASPLATMVDADVVVAHAAPVMAPFEQPDGSAVIPLVGLFASCRA